MKEKEGVNKIERVLKKWKMLKGKLKIWKEIKQ
jgi:hypothetical protein